MSQTTFQISVENVLNRIFASSAYTARSREAMGIPAELTSRMLLTADDKNILAPLIENSVNEIFTDTARYHPGSSVTFKEDKSDGYYAFNINTPTNYPSNNKDRLSQAVESYIANRTLQGWYTDIKPDEAAIAATKAQNDAVVIQMLLVQRHKPTATY
ncbi:MAG: hypothetical protein J6Q73_03735 [Bacteroidaceae bacterium]|nr:hypothetical protein [Bacteroidaceae bacterium]